MNGLAVSGAVCDDDDVAGSQAEGVIVVGCWALLSISTDPRLSVNNREGGRGWHSPWNAVAPNVRHDGGCSTMARVLDDSTGARQQQGSSTTAGELDDSRVLDDSRGKLVDGGGKPRMVDWGYRYSRYDSTGARRQQGSSGKLDDSREARRQQGSSTTAGGN